MNTEIFGHTIRLKSHYCKCAGFSKTPVENPYVNLYVQFKGCNASCKFCEYQNTANKFDREKFKDLIKKLSEDIEIRKISFTGGEPTLNLNDLIYAAETAKEFLPSTFFVLNTNGYKLKELYEQQADKLFNSISLSRHHYDIQTNNKILGFESLNNDDIIKLQNANDDPKIHLSCNVIKDYIDNEHDIYKYLENANKLGVRDIGFVSLMKINEYAKNNFVDFYSIKFNKDSFHKMKEWTLDDKCKCNNYLYIPDDANGDIVKVYSRCVLKNHETTNLLTYDGHNLREGFNGKILA